MKKTRSDTANRLHVSRRAAKEDASTAVRRCGGAPDATCGPAMVALITVPVCVHKLMHGVAQLVRAMETAGSIPASVPNKDICGERSESVEWRG